jgi:uncharacterized membrane protein YgcG
MGIFSWLWPFGKKKEEIIEKPLHMDEYVNRYRRVEEVRKSNPPYIPSVKQLYAAETASERALRLDKERREARIEELSRARQSSRHSYAGHTSSIDREITDRGMDVLGGVAAGYAISSLMNSGGDHYSNSTSSESRYSGGDYSGGGSSDSWSDSGGGDCGGDCDGGGGD